MEVEAWKEVFALEGPVVIPDSCPIGKHPFRSCGFMRGSEGHRLPTSEGSLLLLGHRGG